jgi:hypothetical protein
MAKGAKTGGRQKGSVNKTTMAVKEALTEAFEQIGGVSSLVVWGRLNETEFYKLWAKLLPQEVQAKLSDADGSPIRFTLAIGGNAKVD